MKRLTALALVMALLLGIGTYPLLGAFACPTDQDAMPANCPMREAIEPVAPAAEVAVEPTSCCPKAAEALKAEPQSQKEQRQMTGRCCCDMRSLPDTEDATFVVPPVDLGAWIVPGSPAVETPVIRVVSLSHLPVWKVDAPRGPPNTLHAPRAPPFFS